MEYSILFWFTWNYLIIILKYLEYFKNYKVFANIFWSFFKLYFNFFYYEIYFKYIILNKEFFFILCGKKLFFPLTRKKHFQTTENIEPLLFYFFFINFLANLILHSIPFLLHLFCKYIHLIILCIFVLSSQVIISLIIYFFLFSENIRTRY